MLIGNPITLFLCVCLCLCVFVCVCVCVCFVTVNFLTYRTCKCRGKGHREREHINSREYLLLFFLSLIGKEAQAGPGATMDYPAMRHAPRCAASGGARLFKGPSGCNPRDFRWELCFSCCPEPLTPRGRIVNGNELLCQETGAI